MPRNLTIRIDDDLFRRVRISAAEKDKSVSKLVSEMLERELQPDGGRRRAFQNWTRDGRWPVGRSPEGWKFSREETHERGHHDWSR